MTSKITTETLKERFKITPEKVDQAVKILIKLYNPLKIYVFGSYAQGKQDHGSDVDLMIILPEFTNHPWEMASQGYGSLSDVHMAVDLILYDKARFEKYSTNPTSFCTKIIKTGKLLYEKS
jgi:predicted nucleotidyltransferase